MKKRYIEMKIKGKSRGVVVIIPEYPNSLDELLSRDINPKPVRVFLEIGIYPLWNNILKI